MATPMEQWILRFGRANPSPQERGDRQKYDLKGVSTQLGARLAAPIDSGLQIQSPIYTMYAPSPLFLTLPKMRYNRTHLDAREIH